MVEGNEWMEQPAVATASARAQRGGDRRHSEVPASITAHQADESERPQEPDVERQRHHDDRHHHQHARQDFHDPHDVYLLPTLLVRILYRSTIYIQPSRR